MTGFGPPAIDFYGMLSGLGTTFGKSYDAAEKTRFGDEAAQLYLKKLGLAPAAADPAPAPTADAGAPLPAFASGAGPSGSYLATLIGRESGGDPTAKNPTSSATGLGQFTDDTWSGLSRSHPELGLTPDGRTDPDQSRRAIGALAADNAGILARNGVTNPSDGDLYMAHFLGGGGASRFLTGMRTDPNAPATSYVQPQQAAANRSLFYGKDGAPVSAGSLYDRMTAGFGRGTRVASADPSFMPAAGAAPTPGQYLVAQAKARAPADDDDDEPDTVPSGPGGTGILGARPAAPAAVRGALPTAATSRLQSLSAEDRGTLAQMLANPVTRPHAMAIIDKMSTPEEPELKEIGGRLYRVSKRGGDAVPVGGIERDDAKDPDAYRKIVLARQNWQTLGLPDPSDPQNNAYWKDFATKTLGGGGGVNVRTVLPRAENARDQEAGKAIGAGIAADITAGSAAPRRLQALAILDNAAKAGGDDIVGGPFGKAILSGKQALSALGFDTSGTSESEVTQKIGFQLATEAARSITSRPSQMEFGKALENVPGLLMSAQGRQAMTSILTQQARQDAALGRLASDKRNWDNWEEIKESFYDRHPIISPFTGKPFGQGDIELLTRAAPQGDRVTSAPQPVGGPQGAVRPGALPAGVTPQQALAEARAEVARSPSKRSGIIQQLRAWGVDPGGL